MNVSGGEVVCVTTHYLPRGKKKRFSSAAHESKAGREQLEPARELGVGAAKGTTTTTKMLKFIRGKGQQPSAERQKLQKELFAFRRVSGFEGKEIVPPQKKLDKNLLRRGMFGKRKVRKTHTNCFL